MDITGKNVTIIGAKRSGMALAQMVTRLKGHAKISEKDQENCLSKEFAQWVAQNNIAVEFNGHTRDFIEESDLIVLSPGVQYSGEPVGWAQAKKIPVLGEVEFAAQYSTKPIIAVTGSNGKTTVSTLISKVLQKAGLCTRLCGNIGSPFSKFALDLDAIDFVVLEVSSFQLESLLDLSSPHRAADSINGFKPHIAVVLNFSQNHLDRHKDLEEYYSAKKKIFLNQDQNDFLILNKQDPESQKISDGVRSQITYFNMPQGSNRITNPNDLAVLEVARILNIDESICLEVLNDFEGVEHRLERVRRLNGVDFINDSKATTAQAAMWALENIDQPIVMICGGRDKNIDFSVLAESIQQKVKQMFVIGEARAKIRQAFDELIDLQECNGMEEAVAKARAQAQRGDCVLLSPMCASFDMFADFEERGRVFKDIVNRLV